MICFRCGDDQNLVRSDETATGAICVWCLQHPVGLNEADDATLRAWEHRMAAKHRAGLVR